jgi:hypothetical protein
MWKNNIIKLNKSLAFVVFSFNSGVYYLTAISFSLFVAFASCLGAFGGYAPSSHFFLFLLFAHKHNQKAQPVTDDKDGLLSLGANTTHFNSIDFFAREV